MPLKLLHLNENNLNLCSFSGELLVLKPAYHTKVAPYRTDDGFLWEIYCRSLTGPLLLSLNT